MPNTNLFDKKIKEILLERAEQVVVSDTLKNRIKQEILAQKTEEESQMKRIFSMKKVVIIAAAICFALPISAYAVGHISMYSSTTDKTEAYTEMPTASQLNQELGFVPKTVKSFGNGYSFQTANIDNVDGSDDSGAVVETFKGIMFSYASADGKNVTLSINQEAAENKTANPKAQVTSYNGIDLAYEAQNYRIVPPDYQLTAEEKAAEESGEIVFSYGSQEVTDSLFQFLSWSEDGINYLLMEQDGGLSQADLLDMAKEIINQ